MNLDILEQLFAFSRVSRHIHPFLNDYCVILYGTDRIFRKLQTILCSPLRANDERGKLLTFRQPDNLQTVHCMPPFLYT